MCGITGFFTSSRQFSSEDATKTITRMTNMIEHRGPDSSGIWLNPEAGIALGHRRLSILDLSEAGHQPMLSRTGRYVLVFNGEIYNFEDLRSSLKNQLFRGHSDTEILLAGFEEWGIVKTLERASGMFAIAVWDQEERKLTLARDRIGEKPLYYGRLNNRQVAFASELKSIKAHPDFGNSIDRDSLLLYLRYGHFPTPYTVYRDVYKLLPGTWIEIRDAEDVSLTPTPYWSLKDVAERGVQNPLDISDNEAISLLENELKKVIRRQMIADVPIGAFLSGGIDSSTVVALMQSLSSVPVHTFTIGFNETGFNEATFAKAIAQHLGTHHTEAYITSVEALDVIPSLSRVYDEPFADSSQIPTILVSRLARKHVTVSLSGDGGDELFAGYQRYHLSKTISELLQWIPRYARLGISKLIQGVPPQKWDSMFNLIPMLPNQWKRRSGERLLRLSSIMRRADVDAEYAQMMSIWNEPNLVGKGGSEPVGNLPLHATAFQSTDIIERAMFADTIQYLPDDILVKVDRAAMSTSLETRIPMLDPQMIELAWRFPMTLKRRSETRLPGNTKGKWILREVLARYVPRTMFERPKMGFGVPIGHWLRGPLRDWAETLLSEKRLQQEGYFDPLPIRTKWQEHLNGSQDWQSYLWNVLMWQSWLEVN